MAVNKVVINDVNGENVLIDLTEDNIDAEALVVGFTAHDKSGEIIEGVNPYVKAETDATVSEQTGLISQLKDAISENVSKTSNEVSEQTTLIQQIKGAIAENVNRTSNEVSEQSSLIQQIKTALEGKAGGGGGTVLPTLTNPGTAADLLGGKQLIDANGNVVTGNVAYFSESFPITYLEIEEYWRNQENNLLTIDSFQIPQRCMLESGTRISTSMPLEYFGTASPADVAQGKLFTSEYGLNIEGTATVGGAEVKTATARPSSNSTSISFTGLTAQPKMFAVCPTGNITFNAQNRFIVNVMYDGTTTRGIYAVGSGSWNATYTGTHSASYFRWTYNNGTLTITTSSNTNGGYFSSSVTYQLTYAV